MIRELQLRISPREASSEIYYRAIAAKKIGLKEKEIKAIQLLKRSIDARKKQIWINLSIRVFINEEEKDTEIPKPHYKDVSTAPHVIIVGAGPAGLFAALQCIELGLKPIVLERGKKISERKKDIAQIHRTQTINADSNYGFGEGGAGTFSDGKLYTRSLKRGNVRKILEILCFHGASQNILIDAHPHIGTDKLTRVITAIRQTIESCGGEVHFSSKVNTLLLKNNKLHGVETQDNRSFLGPVILATGHSARDIYELLHKHKIQLEQKTFAVGVRVEHPQALIDTIQYHSAHGRGDYLPAASYALVSQEKDRGVYSFCMCPGGFIVPAATANNQIVVNGMSASLRNSPWANSGIVVEVRPEDLPAPFNKDTLGGIKWQQMLENETQRQGEGQKAPAQKLFDFIRERHSTQLPSSSYVPGLISSDLHTWLPDHIRTRLQSGFQSFDKKMRGFLTNQAVIVASESRTSSPIRIPRDRESCQHIILEGLFPCGEGAGYAGGILSSAMDGEKCAQAVADYLTIQ